MDFRFFVSILKPMGEAIRAFWFVAFFGLLFMSFVALGVFSVVKHYGVKIQSPFVFQKSTDGGR